MANEVSLKVIGNDLGNKPIKVKMTLDTTFQELSDFIIEHKVWDPENFVIRFFRDAQHMNIYKDDDSFESLGLSGDLTVYAEKYDLNTSPRSSLSNTVK